MTVRFLAWLRAVLLFVWRAFIPAAAEAPAKFTRATPPESELPEALVPDRSSSQYSRERTAVHEAGHAVVAWHASTVRSLTISIRVDGGNVFCSHFDLSSPKALWLRAVILLGGIAAECDSYGGFRSGHSSSDLIAARDIMRLLFERGLSEDFSGEHSACGLNFGAMFHSPLATAELVLFETAFNEARALVVAHRHALLSLASLLQREDFVTESQATPILGSRFPLVFLGRIGLVAFLGKKPVSAESP